MFIRDRFYEMVMIWENTAAVSSESMDGKMSLKRHCDRTLINLYLNKTRFTDRALSIESTFKVTPKPMFFSQVEFLFSED